MIVQFMLRNLFQWTIIAGLLLTVRSLSNAPDELRNREGALEFTRLGLTELGESRSTASIGR